MTSSPIVSSFAAVKKWRLLLFYWLEALFRRNSRVGDGEFFESDRFPWIAEVEARHDAIRAELLRLLEFEAAMPNFQDISVEQALITRDVRWKTFFFRVYGKTVKNNVRICPDTAEAIGKIPGATTAFFSILLGHKEIPPHRGPYNGVLRYHLGVLVPDPTVCGITVGGETRSWREGKSLVFDDTFIHFAWNRGPARRAVLFVDFRRPLRFPFNLLNRVVIRLLALSPFIQSALARHHDWEKTFEVAYRKLNK